MELVLWLVGREVDLHWRLDVPRSALPWSFGELAEGQQAVRLGSHTVATLGPAHAAIFNATHGARDSWSTLRALVDQARLLRWQDVMLLREMAWQAGAGRRVDLAIGLCDRLGGRPTRSDRSITDLAASQMWSWLLSGREPKGRDGAVASARMLAVNLGMQDSGRTRRERASTLLWPVREMASRRLGDAGDRRPWLYAASAPYFLPRRGLQKLGVLEVTR